MYGHVSLESQWFSCQMESCVAGNKNEEGFNVYMPCKVKAQMNTCLYEYQRLLQGQSYVSNNNIPFKVDLSFPDYCCW